MGMKRCPFCAEKIQSKAVKCRYCGSSLLDRGDDGTLLVREDSRRGKRRNKRRLWFLLILLVLLVAFFSSVNPETVERKTSQRGSEKEQQGAVKDEKLLVGREEDDGPPPDPVERLRSEVKQALGKSNRYKEKLVSFAITDKSIKIIFVVDDNLTKGMIAFGARDDIASVLKAVQSSKYDYSELVVGASFKLTDDFGNSKETLVLRVTYTPPTINRINWESFISDNVYRIADTVWLHPTFE